MAAKKLIKEHFSKSGMSMKELSRRTGIPYHRVRKAVCSESKIMASDFVAYCKVLNIEIE